MRKGEDAKGLIGSILFHLGAAVVLFLWQVNLTASAPEYLELSLGTVTANAVPAPSRASLPGSEAGLVTPAAPGRRIEDLPERRFPRTDDEVIRVPEGRKLDVEESPGRERARFTDRATGRKDRTAGMGTGTKERFAAPGSGGYAGQVAEPRPGGDGGGAGEGVSVSMTWSDGGTRKKISGDLPEYPEGANVTAQIRIETVVMPDGSVKTLKPLQKGNTRLEEAAMTAVRLWRFEPLRRTSPQRDQTCFITFNFRLR
jgi:TonB family protein